MGKKYIVEIGRLERLYKAFVGVHGKPSLTWLSQEVDPTPYTEPDLEQVRKEAYDKCMNEAEDLAYKLYSPKIDEAYQRGLDDAWKAARKIWQSDNYLRIFKVPMRMDCFTKFSASEAIEKIRAYEQEKEEIKVGDEVVGTYTGEEETEPFVIIRKIPEINPTYYFGIYSKSGEFCQGGLKLKKTGRHFPEIAEVLRKMKETNNG